METGETKSDPTHALLVIQDSSTVASIDCLLCIRNVFVVE